MINIYAIFDVKARIHTIPFFMQYDAPAVRAFVDMLRDKNHQFGKNHGDYSLYALGEYDDETGIIIPDRRLLFDGNVYREETES